MDRRVIMLVAATIALGGAAATLVVPKGEEMGMLLAGVLFGAGAFPLYPLAVAHANDNADPADYVEMSSGLLLIYGLGAAIGPLLASVARSVAGVPLLFIFTAAVHISLIAYVAWRMSQRQAPAAEERVVFAEAAIAAQTVTNFDPMSVNAADAENEDAPHLDRKR